MAEANKISFLGSINPWSRSTTPTPKSPQTRARDQKLKPTSGHDHAINTRPLPSLKRYPNDCPPLRTRWYYAVDVAKRKPFSSETFQDDKDKARSVPRKWLLFTKNDSQAIENAFLQLGREDELGEKDTITKVPVNEDYLYDVHIEKRELEPAYWIGPVYDVRRGSWFYHESAGLRPCDENLANQLEEGYLKITPWRRFGAPRSASQPRHRPSSSDSSSQLSPSAATTETTNPNTYRLFGAHMNTTATYFDANTAYLSADDFMSRMSSTVYGRFGGQSGTKVVRGWSEMIAQPTGAKQADISIDRQKTKSKADDVEQSTDEKTEFDAQKEQPIRQRPSALERQLSSLAGLTQTRSKSHDEHRQEEEEEARVEEQQEMEEAREKDGEDQNRKIDHLVLVTHGIGQRLGLRLDSINFVHDVNTMRKTMKAVFEASPDLQAIAGGDAKNCRIQVLPICWRHLLDFPKQSLKQNRKEHDLGDLDTSLDEEYPSLQDITVDGVPAVRNLITDLALDVLLYQSAYREHVANIVQKEVNRVYQLFKKRTGSTPAVHLCGHSLGSAVFFDLLCRQAEDLKTRPYRVSSWASRDTPAQQAEGLQLDFECGNFFALGSPIALFQMLKGRTVAGRSMMRDQAPPTSPFDSDPMQTNPFQSLGDIAATQAQKSANLIPITTSSPKCTEFYNIFHPTDPIAYRIEPLISPVMASLKAQALPYTKRGLFDAPGMANLTARVGQQVMSGWYSLTSGVASSLINRSLGITGEEQALPADKPRLQAQQPVLYPNQGLVSPTADLKSGTDLSKRQQAIAELASKPDAGDPPTLIEGEMETLYDGFQRRRRSHQSTNSDEPSGLQFELEQDKARRLRREEAKVRALNSNGRVDYHIQEGMFDVSLLASIASHLSYWADADVNHFVIGQILKTKEKANRREEEKETVVL